LQIGDDGKITLTDSVYLYENNPIDEKIARNIICAGT
jgi:hypothetical protein